MKFRHTRRGVIKFLFLGIITLGIYDLCVMHNVRKEVNYMLRDHTDVKRQMPFFWALVLGIITLGIVPLVWLCRMSNKIALAASERGVNAPRLSAGFYFCWMFFGSLIIVGPFIASHAFFKRLNLAERSQNVLDSRAESEEVAAPAEPEALPAPAEVPAPEEAPVEEAPAEAPKEEAALAESEEEKTAESVKDPSLPYQYVTAEPIRKDKVGEDTTQRVYRVTPRKEVSKWQVRTAGGKSIKMFETEEEAIAYAKGLAARRGVSVKVRTTARKKR